MEEIKGDVLSESDDVAAQDGNSEDIISEEDAELIDLEQEVEIREKNIYS